MFTFPSLVWLGLPLVALPILIHLINMLRHRRVKWAAMDFLLQSQKRHKKWIVFKQLLLLLVRMTAIAAVVMMVAQPVLQNEWGEMFGAAKTHHIVLLDDSFSMSDRWLDTSAFDEAKSVVQRLVNRLSREGSSQTFTLLRFSESDQLTPTTQPTMYRQPISAELAISLEKTLGPMESSQTAAGPAEAIDAVLRQPNESKDETRLIYIISDFRAPQWNDPTRLRKSLEQLGQDDTKIHLIQCVDAARDNLAISHLGPKSGVRSAGVEMIMEVAVHNFGPGEARQVTVDIREDGFARPGLVIDNIVPGDTVTREFRVNFDTAGHHTIETTLGSDAIRLDSSRYYTVKMPESIPVLIVDGSSTARDAYFLSAALAPGGKTNTGWLPQVETARFLQDRKALESFAALFLLNIERLDGAAIEAIESYVREGGGVAFFMGEMSRADFFNEQLYRDGEGLFPAPLSRSTELLLDRVEKAPDLTVGDHPVFSILAGKRNSFLQTVQVERYFAVSEQWQADDDSGVRVIAKLRNDAPFALEKPFGHGRVFVQLSKVSPEQTRLGRWNNWATGNPTFPIVINELAGYLSAGRADVGDRLVGQPLVVPIDPQKYQVQTEFRVPRDDDMESIDVTALPGDDGLTATLDDTTESGFYEAHLVDVDGTAGRRVYGYNVDASEGDLRVLGQAELADRLRGVAYDFHRAEALQFDSQELAGFNLSDTLLYVLIAILLGEQLLAYSATYHPPAREGARR